MKTLVLIAFCLLLCGVSSLPKKPEKACHGGKILKGFNGKHIICGGKDEDCPGHDKKSAYCDEEHEVCCHSKHHKNMKTCDDLECPEGTGCVEKMDRSGVTFGAYCKKEREIKRPNVTSLGDKEKSTPKDNGKNKTCDLVSCPAGTTCVEKKNKNGTVVRVRCMKNRNKEEKTCADLKCPRGMNCTEKKNEKGNIVGVECTKLPNKDEMKCNGIESNGLCYDPRCFPRSPVLQSLPGSRLGKDGTICVRCERVGSYVKCMDKIDDEKPNGRGDDKPVKPDQKPCNKTGNDESDRDNDKPSCRPDPDNKDDDKPHDSGDNKPSHKLCNETEGAKGADGKQRCKDDDDDDDDKDDKKPHGKHGRRPHHKDDDGSGDQDGVWPDDKDEDNPHNKGADRHKGGKHKRSPAA